MKNDNDKNEQTIVFSKIDPNDYKDKDITDDDRDFDLERTQEIKHIKLTPVDEKQDNDEKKPKSESVKKSAKKSVEKAESKERPKKEKKKKEKNEDKRSTVNMTDIRKQRKKQKVHRNVKRVAAAVVIVGLGVGVYFSRGLWVPKLEGILDKPHDTIVNDGVTQTGNFPIEMDDSTVNKITRLDNNIIIADSGHIYYYDTNGKLRDTVYHNYGSPVVRTAGKRMLCFDNGGTSFKVYNKSGELFEKKTDASIIYAAIADNGNVAVVSQSEKYTAALSVYDSNGTEIYRWSNGDRIMNISFSEHGAGCYVTAFSSDAGIIVSKVHYIEFDTTDELMQSDELDSLVLEVVKNDNGNIWAIGDEKLYLLDSKGKIKSSYEYPADIVAFDADESCAAVIMSGTAHESTKTAVFDSDSDNAQPKIIDSLSGSPKKVSCEDGIAFVLSSKAVNSYDAKGNLLATAEVSSDYKNFVYYSGAVYFVGSREIDKILFDT